MSDKLKKQQNPFTQVPNALICDPSISGKAKAIYCYLLSRPDNWTFHVTEISKHMKEQREAISNAINELIKLGWITKQQFRDDNGRFTHNEYEIFLKPDIVSTDIGKHDSGKSGTINKDNNNTENNNTNSNKKTNKKEIVSIEPVVEIIRTNAIGKILGFYGFWDTYPKKIGIGHARIAYYKALQKVTEIGLLEAIENQKNSEAWKKDNGKYVPNPANWLDGECWLDEVKQGNTLTDKMRAVRLMSEEGII